MAERAPINEAIDRQMIATHIEQMPGAILGNLVNIMLMLVPFIGRLPIKALLAIGCGVALPVTVLLASLIRSGAHRDPVDRLQRRAIVAALLISSSWALAILVLLQFASLAQITMLGILVAGMMAAASLTCNTVPRAAQAFIAPLFLGAFAYFAWRGGKEFWVINALLVSYTLVLLQSVRVSARNAIYLLRSKFELERHSREAAKTASTIKLLLNDFEEHGSDWLWEVDSNGCIIHASPRFAQAAERPAETLNDTPLTALFASCAELETLENHLTHVRSFKDIVLPVMIGGEQHWWSLTGRAPDGTDGSQTFRGVATDVSAARRAEAKMAYLAHYDGLTDLPNRFLFHDMLNHALHRVRPGSSLAVLSLDLDHFKGINDTLGHPVGDGLLQVVSRRIEAAIRSKDVVARLGGDEFAIMLPGVRDATTVERLATRINQALAEPIEIEGHQVLTSASIGIAMAPSDGTTVDELMKKVDLALYCAKADGRNRFAFFAAGMDEAAQARRMVEMDLRGAINRNELSLYYQPLINVETNRTVGYEALVRWHHPTRGLVMPSEFVPIAEETGMIVQLGEWVIRNAIADAAAWPDHLTVAVNLSPIQMRSGGLISMIVNALAQYQLDPARLEIEITESVLMNESASNLATLHKLRTLGLRIALDDFGTGYSSLNYLRAFPFDKIKIDRCFIEQIDQNPDCQAIVRAVTSLATSLGMVTTAEGVEHDAQLDQLRKEGCDQVQGYLFSKAMPLAELTDLRQHTTLSINNLGSIVAELLPAGKADGGKAPDGESDSQAA